jgi:hypothetical protein
MGRFAKGQDVVMPTSQARRPGLVVRLDLPSGPEIKSNKTKSNAVKSSGRRSKGIKYFWVGLLSLIGLSAGWMMGQVWINPAQEQAAAIEPAVPAEKSTASKQASEENVNKSALPDQGAQAVEQGAQSDQATGDYDRKPGKARRAIARAPRTRGQAAARAGAVSMMLKPFKAINPLKLRRLRPW